MRWNIYITNKIEAYIPNLKQEIKPILLAVFWKLTLPYITYKRSWFKNKNNIFTRDGLCGLSRTVGVEINGHNEKTCIIPQSLAKTSDGNDY